MKTDKKQISEPTFTHLNVHSHYSFLNGLSKIPELVLKAQKEGMYSMALTDHNGMFGIKEFLNTVEKMNANRAEGEPTFKPIVGMDVYCAQRTLYDKSCTNWEKDPLTNEKYLVDYAGWRLTLLAKNLQGYYSLCRLTSLSYIEGLFKDIPKIDRFVLAKNKEGIIVLSGGINGELSQLILQGETAEAEQLASWFKENFGEDYYIELNRHKTDKPNADRERYGLQMKVEPELIRIAKKLGIKLVATNDVHFVLEEHSEAHDRLLCLSSHQSPDDPKRHHYTKQEWLKSPKEMATVFADLPEALESTMEIANKVEMYSINTTPQWPSTQIPKELSDTIKTDNEYLEYLVWNGAQERYGKSNSTAHIQRITSELNVIKNKRVAGYFLMIWDIVKAARKELGVRMSPGRGSTACSIVAYCLYITDIDPLFFNLPFERFYSTQSKSIPDIDLDFESVGTKMDGNFRGHGSIRDVTLSYQENMIHLDRLEVDFGERWKETGIVENLRTEDGKLHSIVSDAAPPVFANPADALLANLPPGDGTSSAPPPPAVSDLEKKFAESLKKEIQILDTDTDDIRAMKQAVMETRAELKRLIDSGQTVAQVLAQHQELANENARVRSNAMAELKQILDSGDIDGAKEYKRKINVALQQMGIAELSIPVTDAEREARAEQRRARRQARRKAEAASGTMPE